MRLVLTLTLLLVALPASPAIYKCRQPDGRTEISNSPCAEGSKTVKTVPDEPVSESSRLQAERMNERMEALADKLEATRRAEEAALREENERQRQAAPTAPLPSGPSPESVESCLRTLDRMALDHYRRLELEAGCRNTGSVQPVYVPVPVPAYYGPSGYPQPYPHPYPNPRPTPEMRDRPTPLPAPATPARRVINPGNPTEPYPFPAPKR